MTIDAMIDTTIGKEGGYVDHPVDRGGPTRWGITQQVARAFGYKGDMRDLPRSTAVEIYRDQYAVKPGFAAVAAIYPSLGEKLFDVGVNMGPARPSLWLQEWLNALNNGGAIYADIAEDGRLGPGTMRALTAYKAKRGAEGEIRLITGIRSDQGVFYKTLARRSPSQEAFVYGWLGRAA